jgi:hypothetical protein
MKFRATVQLDGKTATGIPVPEEVVAALGSSRRPAVVVTIGDFSYRTTVGSMGGTYKVPVSADNRKKAGIAAGDEIEVGIELDTAPREVELPDDLAKALTGEDEAIRFFEGLAVSQKRAYTAWIESAKKAETREKRVTEAVELLRQGRRQR